MKMNLQPLVTFIMGVAMAMVFIPLYITPECSPAGTQFIQQQDGDPIQHATVTLFTQMNGGDKIVPTNETKFADFLPLLEKVATDDKTVLITSVNEAWAASGSFLDVFLERFHNGEQIDHLLNHLIVVAMDPKAFERCGSVHPYCYLLGGKEVDLSSEKEYMSKDYLDLVWSKLKLQRLILEHGYNFLFTDVDIMWFRNPFRHISIYHDITLSSDIFYGKPEDLGNNANTGLIYVKSTKNNIEVLKYWHEAKERFPPSHEQYVFDQIKYEIASKFNAKIQFVDTAYWGGFCHPKKDFNKICTFHGNCIKGLQNKLSILQFVSKGWKDYKDKPQNHNDTTRS